MFDTLRAQAQGMLSTPVAVVATKDLFWSDGETQHLHAKQGERGLVTMRTAVGVIVKFDSGERRQVFDFTGEKETFKLEDEIAMA